MPPAFAPTRAAALDRLKAFVPKAGRAYAARRNYDLGPEGHADVSTLSPWLRHRAVTEEEVLRAVLARHSAQASGKFVQEVFWRTYWKGWLEMRPAVWADYRRGLRHAVNRVQTEAGLRRAWEDACTGATGIAAFDHWARELTETGYLHNHARMWAASIWIFTLRLPWELGADFFLRHLLDGDPASNTLSWRWVAGLQTHGKHYLARPDNIARYTEGRFRPGAELATGAAPLDGPPHPPRQAAPVPAPLPAETPIGLLLTEEDLSPGWLLAEGLTPRASAVLLSPAGRSPLAVASAVEGFTKALAEDAVARHAGRLGALGPVTDDPAEIARWARQEKLAGLVTPYAPVGPVAAALDRLEQDGIALHRALRAFDARAWPHATHGFFRFKDRIPDLVDALGLADRPSQPEPRLI
ncbi:deoxyribodipyrimidine photo-lyase [Rhodovulum iodosum]|uniref:Deoxyribodipyrimidine photo-lyase n=1 Tax=Rhodovulum iodosum TaxID=68291 RepID=A0ABV3XWH0_9RHOB|nr:FAD-binding domain-containing protein [Rhodovulum robiginosum]RSK38377.1 DNA photolyase [Rhodovulum robiginosum]